MSNQPPWMNGGQAPQQQYAQPQQPAYAPPQQQYAQQPQQPLPSANAAAHAHLFNAIANAAAPGERLPKPRAGFGYVLDLDAITIDASQDPKKLGTQYFACRFTCVESEDPSMPAGTICTVRENLTTMGGPGRAKAILQTAFDSMMGKPVEMPPAEFVQALAFATQSPCPLAGRSRLYASVTASNRNDQNGQPWPQIAWEPMAMGSSKGLVPRAAAPAPQAAGVFAGAPWQQGQAGAPTVAMAAPGGQPWAPQGAAPQQGAPVPWPAGIVQTNGQGQR